MGKPSALALLGMAFACIALVLVHVARFGIVHEEDEGTSAHIFQLLMVLQMPTAMFFAAKWFPRAPGQAGVILALWVTLVTAAFGCVYWMEHL